MVVPGILGFQSVVYVVLVLGFVVFRYVWRNAEAKKEEIIRLVEDAAMEMEAVSWSVEYSSIPVSVSQMYQCAVCYSPTTRRCSRCKAVRYCSGKCQISHWRQGHKDECCPPIATMELKEENISCRASVSETQSGLHEIKGTHAGIASTNDSCLGLNPSVAARKSFDDNCHSRFAKPVSDNTADDTFVTFAHSNETVLTPSFPLESKSFENIEVKDSNASKRSKTNSSYTTDEAGFKSRFPKTKSEAFHDVAANLGSHEHRRKVAMVEKSVADTSKCRNVPSLSSSIPASVVDNVEEELHLSKFKEARRSSSSSRGRLSSTSNGDLLSHSKSTKTDNYHNLPAKVSAIPNLPLNVRNGLKTSVQKVVQQFRSSKESRSNIISVENEMGFPYELFTELYCYDKMKLFPFGLTNCGNSCYANAVLQCLAYTRPLTSYLFQGFHSKQCQKKGWCFICEFEYLIQKAKEGNSPLSPIGILSKIHKIGSHLGHGREEDAHEFLRCVVDTMQSICLKEAGVASPLVEETTLVGYTFGGYLRSKIKCLRCQGKSERYERMMDLTVEIDGDIGTLEEALGQFTAPEILDKDNKYNCSRCKSYEKARKKLTVLEAPNILTIVLKRFQSGNFEKLNKSVQFPEVLNMAPYMSGTKDKSPLYSLYAVVVHLDIMNAAFSGHYVCYVKNIQGEWFRTDDSRVEPVELSRVLSERAYMLLYARHSPKPPGSLCSNAISSAGKFKRRNLEAIPAASKTRSSSMATSADSPNLQQKHGLNNEFVHPEEWRFNYGGRNTVVDSSSECSLFSSSDASSCSTASKDSASSADFSDYIFGELGPNWYSHYGLSSNSVASSSYDNLSTDFLVDSDARRPRQDSEDKAVLHANKNKNHGGIRGIDLKRYFTANHCDKNSGVHVRRTSRDASAQTFY
ncbi:ubiquitin carboxyl-terminal hydrolase 17 isoform X2 [Gastrolobium bilobum]|uniref:ubiquitin carboxyl-terminal hydrolase 17 isoform X2 n=1 Tax=Gastrolobium bilobum TaxID=150636 RepID=UPI002AAF4242|nr:ubiquitin carboxyl-terminal hydrolase 17 isoform X2 [Gastrolobium bilobum]